MHHQAFPHNKKIHMKYFIPRLFCAQGFLIQMNSFRTNASLQVHYLWNDQELQSPPCQWVTDVMTFSYLWYLQVAAKTAYDAFNVF